MTSFDFVTATCGTCHPGGGPLEFDRNGKRYDRWMKDSSSGLTPGGENHLDGDYFKARWSETGVLEADCLLCHLPDYDCKDCHLAGYLNAPIAKHDWLPSLHLEKIACQTCHINERPVTSALVQVSDVYNSGAKISPPPKHIWTFYDQNMICWNHYGELNMFTVKDEPTDPSRPIVARYKDKIFPVNPVHSA